MKKLLGFVSALMILVMSIPLAVSSASAESFTIYNVHCVSESDELRYFPTKAKKTSTTYQRVKINHSAQGTSNNYTNLFHATRSLDKGSATGILSGQKWCTPGLTVNITSTAIYPNYYYGLACRGNTKYNQYEGLISFTVSGTYDPN